MGESLLVGIGDEVLIYCGAIVTIFAGAFTVSRFLPSSQSPPDDMTPTSTGRAYNSEICPICLGQHRLALETNCGHKFCGACIRGYLNNRAPSVNLFSSGNIACPMCRQQINLILLAFSPEDRIADAAERREIESAVYAYNVRYGGGPRSWLTYIRDCPVLVRHMFAEFFSFDGLVWMFRLRVLTCFAAAIMYLLMPLDIVPEAIFGLFGLLDDMLIVFLCAIYLSIIYRRFLLSRANDAEM